MPLTPEQATIGPTSIHASARDSQVYTGKSGSVACGVTAPFSWVLVHTRVSLCPSRVSVFQVLWEFCNQILMICKVRFPRDILSLAGSPGWEVCLSLELSQQCENFFGIIVLQFVSHLPGDYSGVNGYLLQEDLSHTLRLPALLCWSLCAAGGHC